MYASYVEAWFYWCYVKIPKSTLARWQRRFIIWSWVIVYKYSNGTINQIDQKIIVQKKLTLICSKLIFRRLLLKRATECAYKFNNRFLKQVDSCTLGEHYLLLSMTFIWSKLKMILYYHQNLIFYQKFIDNIYSRMKINSTFTRKVQN